MNVNACNEDLFSVFDCKSSTKKEKNWQVFTVLVLMIFCAFNLSMLQNSCFRQTVECTDKLMKQTVLTRVCLLRSKYYYVQLCCLWKASKWFSSSLGVSAPPQVLAGEGKCLAQSPGTCYFGGMQGLAFTYQSLQQWRCGETQVSHQRAPNMCQHGPLGQWGCPCRYWPVQGSGGGHGIGREEAFQERDRAGLWTDGSRRWIQDPALLPDPSCIPVQHH